jgi:hypothetical protein
MDHQKEEAKSIKKTDKDTEALIKIQRIGDKETMKCLLKMILKLKKISLKNRLQALDQNPDKIINYLLKFEIIIMFYNYRKKKML